MNSSECLWRTGSSSRICYNFVILQNLKFKYQLSAMDGFGEVYFEENDFFDNRDDTENFEVNGEICVKIRHELIEAYKVSIKLRFSCVYSHSLTPDFRIKVVILKLSSSVRMANIAQTDQS